MSFFVDVMDISGGGSVSFDEFYIALRVSN